MWLILFLAVMMIPMTALFALTLAAFIFSSIKIFPFARGIAEWVTDRRNLLPFVLFMLIAIVITAALLTGADYFASQVHWVGWFAFILLLLIIGIECIIFGSVMGLAMILWIIRLSHWGYAHFRTRFERTSPPSRLPAYRSRRRLPARQPIKNQSLLVPSTGEKANAKADAKQKVKAKAGEETEAYYESEFQRLLGEAKTKAKTKAKTRLKESR